MRAITFGALDYNAVSCALRCSFGPFLAPLICRILSNSLMIHPFISHVELIR